MKIRLALITLCMLVVSCNAVERSAVVETSFEEFKQGELTELKSEYGVWQAKKGNAAIDSLSAYCWR